MGESWACSPRCLVETLLCSALEGLGAVYAVCLHSEAEELDISCRSVSPLLFDAVMSNAWLVRRNRGHVDILAPAPLCAYSWAMLAMFPETARECT